MPIKFQYTGLDEMAESLNAIGANADEIASAALYKGAGVIADAVSKSINGLSSEPFHYAPPGQTRLPSPEEIAAVKNAKHGIARFKNNGYNVNTSIGFQNSGYVEIAGKTVPVPLIANSIESGTSFMTKQPFMRKAVNSSKKQAVSVMEDTISKSLENVLSRIDSGTAVTSETIKSSLPNK